jgi:hypothetical protein
MKPILKQIAWLGVSLILLYGICLGVSLLLVPLHRQAGGLNIAEAANTIYVTEPKYAFLNRSTLRTDADSVILLGASNVVAGFKPRDLQPLLPTEIVHNLAIGGSNLTQISQVYDLVRAEQGPTGAKHSIFVIGIWYGLFVPDSVRWNTPDRHAGDTDIDIERYRYGFYRRTEFGPEPVIPPDKLDLGVLLIHPYLVLDRAVRQATDELRDLIHDKPPDRTNAERNATVLSEEQKAKYIAFWNDQFNGATAVSEQQFKVLSDLINRILDGESKVLLVDLPVPAWHLSGVPFTPSYEVLKNKLIADFKQRPGFTFLGMQNVYPDDEFSDEVHPKPRVTQDWSRRLADQLTLILANNNPVAAP